jgi:DNA-directed RNA polymerase sigma subunit (sigma70/sigma32)
MLEFSTYATWWIRQIEAKALRKLRHHTRNRKPKDHLE